jgi:hypothetical protein
VFIRMTDDLFGVDPKAVYRMSPGGSPAAATTTAAYVIGEVAQRIDAKHVLTLSMLCRDRMHRSMDRCCVHCIITDMPEVSKLYPAQCAYHVYSNAAALKTGVYDVLWHYKTARPPYPAKLVIDENTWRRALQVAADTK